MIETVFFAAISSDGYLAGPDGDMSWAEKYLGLDEDYGFTQVMSDSVGVLMGARTFEFELAALGDQQRMLPTFVLTNEPFRYDGVADPNVHFMHGPIDAVLAELGLHVSGQLMVMGGADVVRQLLDAGLLNRLQLFVTPDVLGGGLQLFEGGMDGALGGFTLTGSREFSTGLRELDYRRH